MFKNNLLRFALFLFIFDIILTSCSDGDTSSASPESTRTIYGSSQKGPFIKGTQITLYGMNEKLHQTGTHFSTKIDNNQGLYTLKNIPLEDRYAWLNANGYYIDEITGDTSAQSISLNSLVDLKNRDQFNINILTHLSFYRILNLVKKGKSVEDAKRQAETEVLKAFGFTAEEESFDQLDILNSSEGDAKLLAISLMMLTAADVGEVTDRLATIAMDLEEDGTWDDSILIKEIKDFIAMDEHDGVYKKIHKNLKNMGATEIPDFQKLMKQFASSWDSAWMHCDNLDEVKRTSYFNDSTRSRVICRDGIWKYYHGIRNEYETPVDTTEKYGTLVDERDGHVYKTLDIKLENGKTATWMASLLEYEVPNSPKTNLRHIPGVGREYTECQIQNTPTKEHCMLTGIDEEVFNQILSSKKFQGICPDGWHIPQGYEWENLKNAIKNDRETQELLVYLQYVDSETQKSLDANSEGYYNAFQLNFSFNVYDDVYFIVMNTSKFDQSFEKPPYALRCVKD